MPRLMEKAGQPCCPKCGAEDWSAKKEEVCDQNMIDFVTEKAKEEGKIMANMLSAQTGPQTTAGYEAEFELLMQEAENINSRMQQGPGEIEHLKTEEKLLKRDWQAEIRNPHHACEQGRRVLAAMP